MEVSEEEGEEKSSLLARDYLYNTFSLVSINLLLSQLG